jgi:hypothetical protein
MWSQRQREDQRLRYSIERLRARHRIEMQRFLAKFICGALGLACAAAFVLFYLQGFQGSGFRLESSLMHWIGAATIGALAGLAAAVYGAFFRKK